MVSINHKEQELCIPTKKKKNTKFAVHIILQNCAEMVSIILKSQPKKDITMYNHTKLISQDNCK